MFNLDSPKNLDESKGRQNRAIVYFHRSWKGHGDAATALKLSQGLKRDLDIPIELMVGREEDFQAIEKRCNLKRGGYERPTLTYQGLKVTHLPPELIYREIQDSAVGIFTPLAIGGYEHFMADNPLGDSLPQMAMMRAGLNIYVQEYDARTINPHFMQNNRFYRDAMGNLHFIASTGFNPKSLGILIEDHEVTDKPELIEAVNLGGVLIPTAPEDSLWGLAYFQDRKRFCENYLNPLRRSLAGRKATIFDFTAKTVEMGDAIEEGRFWADKDFCHIYAQDSRGGEPRVITLGDPKNDITIVHLGNRDYTTFLGFMQASDLPVLVTGDASLSEAISMNKLWIYDIPEWKHLSRSSIKRSVRSLLAPGDVRSLLPVFGVSGIPLELLDEKSAIETFGKLERALAEIPDPDQLKQEMEQRYRELERANPGLKIYEIGELVNEEYYGKLLKIGGHQIPREAIRFLASNSYLIGKKGQGADEGEPIMFGIYPLEQIIDEYFKAEADNELVFTSEETQTAIYRFNQALRQSHNLTKNLAKLINHCRKRGN